MQLSEGSGVTWPALDTPMIVAETREATEETLRGPDGGEYELRERYDSVFLVYPGYGRVSDLVRVAPADDRHERV
ncbi:hypothetical protein [Halococcus salifodinae]|uniref:Uncharacterized protein n=1 Tax=Halococcus salifodinae DSM 8989 TaxID=1227456 RepID=M0MQ53_9EURY|nr:hypothetical protein [Halococcus salifodinae]EMA47766.1 hypothetical protein C450_20646 [Halococcus salifodinae DSM 8989]